MASVTSCRRSAPSYNGPLNDAQIDELVVFIQHVDWNEVYNAAIEQSGGYPTPPPAAVQATETTPDTGSGGDGGVVAAFEIDMVDLAFEPTELTIPANTDVTINLVNKGALPHAFEVKEQGSASAEIAGGIFRYGTVNSATGQYDFDCPVPGHADAGMVGKLIVSEDAVMPGGDASPVASPVDGGGAAVEPVELDMVDLAFEPTELTIPGNVDVTINLVNKGALPHAFQLADGSVTSDEIAGGATGSVVVNLPPGTYDFICPVPGHADAGMVGKLIVTEGDATAAVPPTDDAGATAAGPIEVDMVDLAFEPTEITIPANQDVTVTLVNNGALPHQFEVKDQDIISAEIPGGGSGEVVINLPPGEYAFDCPIPGHADAGMVGKLIVK